MKESINNRIKEITALFEETDGLWISYRKDRQKE